jgi:hypothetical protein
VHCASAPAKHSDPASPIPFAEIKVSQRVLLNMMSDLPSMMFEMISTVLVKNAVCETLGPDKHFDKKRANCLLFQKRRERTS